MYNIGIILGSGLKVSVRAALKNYAVYEAVKIVDAGRIAKTLESKGAEAIICTGGTLPETSKHVNIPVISANPTYFDLLETVKEMETVTGIRNNKVALILHESRTIDISRLQSFAGNQLSLVRYRNENHIAQIVENLAGDGYEILIGGPTTQYYANLYGIKSFLLLIGQETMMTAVEKTTSLLDLLQKDREQNQKLQTVFDIFPEGILATDKEGNITMCNPNALRILQSESSDVINKKVYQLMADPTWMDVYQKGISQKDIIREYKRKKVFMTRHPMVANNRIVGAVATIQDAAHIQKLEHQYRKIQTMGLVAKYKFDDIVGESLIMREVIDQAKAYANTNSTVLIEGETGTGKELFAQSLHNYSQRRHGPFVAINCAALPETLLESELMGYEEGAFTGARRGGKPGLFELAHQGTIFLDEINQIPIQLQARVLRVIQERLVLRLGGEKVIPVDVRIMAATNENLEGKVARGQFRDDLYYRLNVLHLHLPPLRERKEDIPQLLASLIQKFSGSDKIAELPLAVIQRLMNYNWPGNVRELTNFAERYSVLQSRGTLDTSSFLNDFMKARRPAAEVNIDPNLITLPVNSLKKMEQEILNQVISKCGGNKAQAALLLGISRTSIWNKLKSD